jgi:uncharacterized membrane protein
MKFLKKYFIKLLFIVLLLPYLTSYIFVTKHLPKIEEINQKTIQYVEKADDAYKAYQLYEGFDDVVKEKEKQIKKSFDTTEDETKDIVKKEISSKNAISIASSLFKKETPKEFKNIEKKVKSKAKANFKLDINVKDEIAKQKSHPIITKIKEKLSNNEFLKYMKLALMIPVFSVISVILLIAASIIRFTMKKALSEKECALLSNISIFWMTTLSLSLIGLLVYPFATNIGLGIIMFTNVYYIFNCIKGVTGFGFKKCPSCNQELN